ncbi:MAG: trypsin-like serine protease, partial [Proteobacteria bacterium]
MRLAQWGLEALLHIAVVVDIVVLRFLGMKRRWPSLALMSFLFILQACGVETKDSRLGIIGGQVWNKTPSPVIAYTVVAGSSVSGPAFSRTCTATRVSDTDFITAANCFDNYLSNNGKLAFISASTGDRLSGIAIKSFRNHEAFDPTSDTGSNNIAIFTIAESTPKLNETVLKADIDLTRPATAQAIEVFGGGCESVNAEGACASKSTWLGGVIKSFQTKVVERDDLPANLSGKFFFSNNADGSFAGDDLGGPVFKYDPS